MLQPISPYASTKVSGELLGHVYSHLYGIRFIALRFFTVYGPRQRPDLAITKFARLMLDGRSIPVFGDGSTRRDYTYVDDIIAGVIAAIEYDRLAVRGDQSRKQSDGHIARDDRRPRRGVGVQRADRDVARAAGDVPQTWANVEKAQRLLGYAPTTPYAKAFVDSLRGFRRCTIQNSQFSKIGELCF